MHNSTQAEPRSRAGRREWIGLAVLALPTLLVSLDIGALFLALPQLSTELSASGTQQLWITDIYIFMNAGFLVTMGTLGDRIGRRRLLMIGAVGFGIATVLAAYSMSAEMLIVTRALLGIAGATLMPSTLALISNMFRDSKERSTAIAAWVTCLMAGAALGPVIGGVLLEYFWWGSVFLLGVPVMLVLLVAGPILLPEYRAENQTGRIDLVSVVLSLATILPVIHGLKELARDGWAPAPVLAMLVGVAVGVAFVRRQRRLSNPLLDVRLFTNRAFSATLAVLMLGGAGMAGIFLLVSQYVQTVGNLTPATAGLLLAPAATALAIGAMLTPAFVTRVRPGPLFAAAFVIAAVGYLLLTQAGSGGGVALAVIGIAIVHVGAGPVMVRGTELIVGSAPPEKAGSAASLSETMNHFGTALGLAVMGSIGTAVYRDQFVESVPAGLPGEAVATASETVAAAVAVAQQLGGESGALLAAAAREAFTTALNVGAGVTAAVAVALAVVALSVLRKLPAAGKQVQQQAHPKDTTAQVDGAPSLPVSLAD